MEMNNINQSGYACAPPMSDDQPLGNSGFVPGNSAGYVPVPQMAPSVEAKTYGGGAQQLPHYGGPQAGGYGPQPIISQPGVPAPAGIPNCPRGLEYLTTVDQLLVEQKVELLEVFTDFETKNKFCIKNALGQKVFYAMEESDCCSRNLCGSFRPFEMKIFDNFRNEVIHLNRPLACSACCFPCCLQTMEVSAPPGNLIGTIEQELTFCSPSFRIKNHNGDTVLRIQGPFCTMSCFGGVKFDILSLDGTEIGKIKKQWSGLSKEMFTDADNFGITMPLDMDVRMKAILLGATFLIDAMFFEDE